jgi:hypothetical protein
MFLGLVLVVGLLLVLDLLALNLGADSRDGRDWSLPRSGLTDR